MRNHKWSEQDYALLEKNVKELGFSKGCKKTAEQIYVSMNAAKSMYWVKFRRFKKSGIKVDHPEIAKKARVVEKDNQVKRYSRWTEIEIEILKNNLIKYGWKKGCERTSVSTGRNSYSCKNKAALLIKNGFEGYAKRINLNEKEDELINFFETRMAENPNNLQAVFREGAELFGISKYTLQKRWYGNDTGLDKKPTCRKNMKPVFTVLGKNATINGKNQNEPDVTETKNIFIKVANWFKKKFNR